MNHECLERHQQSTKRRTQYNKILTCMSNFELLLSEVWSLIVSKVKVGD